MELKNDFVVNVPVAEAWGILTDVERIAPLLPGAQLQEVEGEEYRGVVKVKVGPITAQYKGKATFVEKDDAGHKAVLKAEGRETRGQGNASALITVELHEEGSTTHASVTTDLTVTGRVAQFGRGVLADVSAKLLGQFVESLEQDIQSGGSGGPAAASAPSGEATESEPSPAAASAAVAVATADASGNGHGPSAAAPPAPEQSNVRRIDHPEAEPVDLLDTAGAPVAKRVAPLVGILVLFLLFRRIRRRRRAKKA